MTVAVARADDTRSRWSRRRRAPGRGGAGAAVARPPAAGPVVAAGARGDGRAFQGRGREGHHEHGGCRGHRGRGDRGGNRGHGGRGGAARGPAGGDDDEDEDEEPVPPAAGRGGPRGGAAHGGRGACGGGGAEADALLGASAGGAARGGSGGLALAPGHPTVIREDARAWFEFDGNPNFTAESSSRVGRSSSQKELNKHEKLPNPVAAVRKGPNFLPFNELEIFENHTGAQTPQIDELNDDLVIIFESISVLRKNVYEMMITVSEANDPASRGKEIGDEVNKATVLLKEAQEKVAAIEALGGTAVPIPDEFHMDVKPQRL